MNQEPEDRPVTPAEILADFPVPVQQPSNGNGSTGSAVSVSSRDVQNFGVRPDAFLAPTIDKKARSERINARIDPAAFSAIQRLVESGIFGWSTSSDFMRWAIDTGIQIAARALNNPQLSNELQVSRGILRRYQARERERLYSSMVQLAINEVRVLEAQGSHGDARAEFERIVQEAESLSIAQLRERFLDTLAGELPTFWAELILERMAQEVGSGDGEQ